MNVQLRIENFGINFAQLFVDSSDVSMMTISCPLTI